VRIYRKIFVFKFAVRGFMIVARHLWRSDCQLW